MASPSGTMRHELAALLRLSASAVASERRAAITGLGTVVRRPLLGSVERDAIMDAITQAAGDPDPKVRLRAVRGLGRLPASRAYAVVSRLLTDDDYTTREAAVRTLIRVDSDRGAQALIAAARDARAPVRSAVLIGLRAVRTVHKGVLDALVAGLADAEPSVQGAAMASLRALASRDPQLASLVTDLALQGLDDDSPPRREISIELLRQLKVPGHRQRCLAALSDPDPRVRHRARRGL